MSMDMKAVKNAYATYEPLPDLGYNIIKYLIESPEAEIIWKLLKYPDADAWKKPDLSKKEKTEMIYDGIKKQDDCMVFFDYFMDEATNQEKSYLRIYPANTIPTNRTVGVCCINFEIFIHSQINHLSNYKTRLDVIIQKILEILNGRDIGGVGVLFFDASRTSYCRMITVGEKPYKGKLLVMGVNLA